MTQKNTIAALRKALIEPEYFDIPISIGMIYHFDKKSQEVLFEHLKETDQGIVLPLRKFYSLTVENEESLQIDESNKEPINELKELVTAIAKAEGKDYNYVQNLVQKLFANGLDFNIVPLDWLAYSDVLNKAYYKVMFGANNAKIVRKVLNERGITLPDDSKIPVLFAQEIGLKFVMQERNAWIEPEKGDDSELGKSTLQEIDNLKEQVKQLTTTVSTLILKAGISPQTIDTQASKTI